MCERSTRGTRFFAHRTRGTCTSSPETWAHLLAKDVIAKAAEAVGWEATTEEPGETPAGGNWIADVICQRSGENGRVAVEVQWSAQSIDETRHRQARYKESRVRGLWLLRRGDLPIERETPAF